MTNKDFDHIVKHFGKDRIIAALPQKDVCRVLGLVCIRDLTTELRIGYDQFRRLMETGKIPFPEVRLLRRCYFTAEEAAAVKEQVKQEQRESLALTPKER